jgi:hypothetical protein
MHPPKKPLQQIPMRLQRAGVDKYIVISQIHKQTGAEFLLHLVRETTVPTNKKLLPILPCNLFPKKETSCTMGRKRNLEA